MVNSKKTLSIRASRRPQVGDEVWAKPVRIDSQNVAYLKNPYGWGGQYIRVPDISDLDTREFSSGRHGFQNPNEPTLVRITGIESGTLRAESIENTHSSTTIQSPSRDESIEWHGTDQEAGSGGARDRTDVRREGDIRGSKNDLL